MTESDQEVHKSVHLVNSSVSGNFMKVANIACADNTTGKISEQSTMYSSSVGEQTNFDMKFAGMYYLVVAQRDGWTNGGVKLSRSSKGEGT